MAKKSPLTPEEAAELFSQLDHSGVLDPAPNRRRWRKRKAASGEADAGERGGGKKRRVQVDPLSQDDPSGSNVAQTISRTAIAVIVGVLVLVLGMQIAYGVNRRLSTANLSETVDRNTVEHAMETGVEWGNGFTQFPSDFTVDEADERTGVVEVSVVDTDSENELELLSNSQIQSAALATNALLNDKIDRVVYNVFAYVGDDGSIKQDWLFGIMPADGMRRAILTFIWTKNESTATDYIDWELKIIGMDEETTQKIQDQVNSVSSLVESPSVSQGDIEDEQDEQQREHMLHGTEIFRGGPAEKQPGPVEE